jgi:hypothetical protein
MDLAPGAAPSAASCHPLPLCRSRLSPPLPCASHLPPEERERER